MVKKKLEKTSLKKIILNIGIIRDNASISKNMPIKLNRVFTLNLSFSFEFNNEIILIMSLFIKIILFNKIFCNNLFY